MISFRTIRRLQKCWWRLRDPPWSSSRRRDLGSSRNWWSVLACQNSRSSLNLPVSPCSTWWSTLICKTTGSREKHPKWMEQPTNEKFRERKNYPILMWKQSRVLNFWCFLKANFVKLSEASFQIDEKINCL